MSPAAAFDERLSLWRGLALAFVASLLVTGVQPLRASLRFRTRQSSVKASVEAVELDESFWKEGLQFGCTGCGRCCQNEGEVWLNGDEFHDLVNTLKLPADDVIDCYVDEIMSGWVRLKSKQPIVELGVGVTEQCVFLDDDGKRCTVYNARPIQCRTYPWWPNMIANADAWAVEAVLPEEGSAVLAPGLGDGTNTNPPKEAQRKWSAEDGGCEGINNKDAPIVPPITIHRNKQLYNLYNADFPYAKAGNDRQKLLSTFDVVQRVISSTKKWVDQFVIGYNLCPFAESVFSGDRVRYRAFLGTDRSKIIERIRLEVLDLLATDEDSVATTLLMLPFAFPDFEEFYAFSLDLEDIILPLMEKRSRPDFDDFDKAPAGEEEESKEIQLAFFHPTFAWADTEVDAPLNFEKRAPFPTINLLRAVRVREYANQARTSSISNKNVASLEGTGGAVLSAQFNKIIMEALAP